MTAACNLLGHTWVARPIAGSLTEVCSTCGARPPLEES